MKQALSALRVPLNKRRLVIVDAAFCSVAAAQAADQISTTDGLASRKEADVGREEAVVPLSETLACMNPDGHPEVAAGRLSAQEVIICVVIILLYEYILEYDDIDIFFAVVLCFFSSADCF